MGTIRFDIEIVGVVNGVQVTVAGRGHVGRVEEQEAEGPEHRRLDMELHADVVPLHWDPALVVFGSLDVILTVAALAEGTGADFPDDAPPDPVFARTDLVLLDEGHRELGRMETSLRAEIGPGCVRIRGQFQQARISLEPDECVTTVERVCVGPPVPLGRDGAVLTSTASFETSFGHEVLAVVVARVVGGGSSGAAVGNLTTEPVSAG